MRDSSLLVVRNAGRRIDEGWIWRGISLELRPGTRLGVAGPSGSGKTLLLRSLAGLDRLDEGTVLLQGRSISDLNMPVYRARVLYLPQSPALLDGTVEENLRLAFTFSVHRDKSFSEERLRERLDLLDRDATFLKQQTGILSGGERQIAAFLRAIQLDPNVLLLDEPTSNLDPEGTSQIERLVTTWLEEQDERAAIWTSHQADQLERMTDTRIDLTRHE